MLVTGLNILYTFFLFLLRIVFEGALVPAILWDKFFGMVMSPHTLLYLRALSVSLKNLENDFLFSLLFIM